MRILVTGADGFIGRIIAEGLQKRGGYEVVGLCRAGIPEKNLPGMTWVVSDLLSREVPLLQDLDYIVHTASVQDSRGLTISDFIGMNLAMTENVANLGRRAGVKGVVHTSSIDVHGEVRSGILDENTDRINPSLYGVSKYLCERLLEENCSSFSTISLRLCGVIGPGAHRGWIASVLAHAIAGESIGIYNETEMFNNVIHTDDILQLLLILFTSGFTGFKAFPIASSGSVPIRNVVEQIVEAVGSSSKIVSTAAKAKPFMISSCFAMDRFMYAPTAVSDNLGKYVREMSRGHFSSPAER
jgi:nucleoside-diphosphate-sugar epimerase